LCRLHAAAPDLLEACKGALWQGTLRQGHTFECNCSQATDAQLSQHPQCISSCKAIRAAIAKATGFRNYDQWKLATPPYLEDEPEDEDVTDEDRYYDESDRRYQAWKERDL
jgi:hypothetical protein